MTGANDDGDDYWERMLKAAPYYETVEKLRDAIDVPDWRQVEAAQDLIERRSGVPPREISDSVGTVTQREYRQVNVKLSEADFDLVRGLAIESDVAISTMARMLLRKAVLAAVEVSSGAAPRD